MHVERREQLAHLALAGGAHRDHRAVALLEQQSPLVKVDPLGAHGAAHVRDGEREDGLLEVALLLLLLREHVEHRVAQHEPAAHPLLVQVVLGQVEPPLREDEIWGGMGRYGEVWGDMGRHGEMWGGMGRCGEVWGEVWRGLREDDVEGGATSPLHLPTSPYISLCRPARG